MDHLNLAHLSPQTALFLVLALLAGWLAWKATKQLVLGTICALLALGLVGVMSGVITTGRVETAVKKADQIRQVIQHQDQATK